MIFGYQFTGTHVMVLGLVTIALLVFQMLVGLRIIHFKGRLHMKVHRRGAWLLVVLAIVHMVIAFAVYGHWRIF